MSEIIGASVEEVPQEQPASPDRVLALTLTFSTEGVKIDVKSNLTALEQLGAVEIFKAHLLSSALGQSNG
jgi:hypothetical protein